MGETTFVALAGARVVGMTVLGVVAEVPFVSLGELQQLTRW